MRNFIAHPMIFSQISETKIELPTDETDINLDKKVIQHWFFAISWKESILNYPIHDIFNMSPTHFEKFRQIAQIDYCGVGTSKSRPNLNKSTIKRSLNLAYIYCMEINQQYLCPLLPWAVLVALNAGSRRGAEPQGYAQFLLHWLPGAAEGRNPDAVPSFCCIESWEPQRGRAPRLRPVFVALAPPLFPRADLSSNITHKAQPKNKS